MLIILIILIIIINDGIFFYLGLQIANSPSELRFKANLYKRMISKQSAVISQKSQLI